MKNKQRALVILTPGFPASEADTFTPPQQVFVKALKGDNPDLNVIVLAFRYPYFSKIYHWHGVTVISFGSAVGDKLHNAYTGLRAWLTLKRQNKKHQIIGLLSFWLGKPAFIGDKFANKYNLKHYTWLLGQDARAGNKFVNRIKPDGSDLIALSDFIKREFTRNYSITPQHIIPVSIDPTLFSNETPARDIDVFGAGSLIPLKQYDIFLEVIAALKTQFPKIKSAIAGTGAQLRQLEHTIKTLGLENNVTLLGWLSHAEVLTMMQRTKVFLHPSNYEGFGAVCLEALYAGAKVASLVKPMNAPIPNWHIVADKQVMIERVQGILSNKALSYHPVLPYTIQDNVKLMMQLFE